MRFVQLSALESLDLSGNLPHGIVAFVLDLSLFNSPQSLIVILLILIIITSGDDREGAFLFCRKF